MLDRILYRLASPLARMVELNKRWYHSRYWYLHHERKTVRRANLDPEVGRGELWPSWHSYEQIRRFSFTQKASWDALKPYDREMRRLTRSYVWRDEALCRAVNKWRKTHEHAKN